VLHAWALAVYNDAGIPAPGVSTLAGGFPICKAYNVLNCSGDGCRGEHRCNLPLPYFDHRGRVALTMSGLPRLTVCGGWHARLEFHGELS